MKRPGRNGRHSKSYSPRRLQNDRRYVIQDHTRTSTRAQGFDNDRRDWHDRSDDRRYGVDQRSSRKPAKYSPYDHRREPYSRRHRQGQSSNSTSHEEFDRRIRDVSPISSHESFGSPGYVQIDSWTEEEEHGRRNEMDHFSGNIRTRRQGSLNELENEYVQIRENPELISIEALQRKGYPSKEEVHDTNERQTGIYSNCDTQEDAVSHLLNIVLQNGGQVTMSRLDEEMNLAKTQAASNTLKFFLMKYPKVFEFDQDMPTTDEEGKAREETEIVRARTEVKICEAHSNTPGSCRGNCNSLHICKYFILSSCDITKCKFGHDWYNKHNIKVQCKFYLHKVDFTNVRLLLRHDGNRCSVTIPVICRYYNAKGCRSKGQTGNKNQKQKCPYLHVCQKFVEGVCDFCRLNHNFLQADVHEILCKYGLDLGHLWKGEERVLNMMRSSIASFQGRGISRNLRGGYVPMRIDGDEVASGLNNKIQMRNDNAGIMANIQRIFMNNQNADRTDTISDKSGDSSIGTEDIDMDSNHTESSKSSHLKFKNATKGLVLKPDGMSDKTAQHWSICDNDTREDISQADMDVLEEFYQTFLQAKQPTVTIKGKRFEVDFTKMDGCFVKSKKRVRVQRNKAKTDSGCKPGMPDTNDENKARHINDENKNVSFENVKDIDFMKL